MNLFEIISLRRSGHHAFINWLISNLVEAPYGTQSAEYAYDTRFNILYVNQVEFEFPKHQNHISTNKERIDYLITSTETAHAKFTILNKLNPTFSNLDDTYFKDEWNVLEYKRIFFIRDFYNCFASQIKASPRHWEIDNPYATKMYNNWKSHASSVLEGDYGVIYDKWISDFEYANQVSLDILNVNNIFNPLDIRGTISSFNANEKVNLKKYLTRYKEVEFPMWFYDKIKNDEELQLILDKFQMNYLF